LFATISTQTHRQRGEHTELAIGLAAAAVFDGVSRSGGRMNALAVPAGADCVSTRTKNVVTRYWFPTKKKKKKKKKKRFVCFTR
jgi:hypothetical protein